MYETHKKMAADDWDEMLAFLRARSRGTPAELVPLLLKTQAAFGYLPREALEKIANFLRIPESRVYSVASFYTQFRFTPVGRHRVLACRGTACHVKGAVRVLEELKKVLGVDVGETTSDGEYTLETVACIGCCALAPCAMVDDRVAAKLTPAKVGELFGRRKDG
jgi:NADH-quinone oxidoreductase subunit E